ncbi:MAG: PorT family protein [Prevotellaceae bacterium]|jgi:hypothetical protein|nr:PorT family protein [Prevotellaceae bacterium]
MKKILLIIVSLCAVYATATAQDFKKGIFGVRVGLNISNVLMATGDIKADNDARIGFNAGVSYQHLLSSTTPVYLETGLYFTDKGYKRKINWENLYLTDPYLPDSPSRLNAELMYLQIPVLLNYHFITGANTTIRPFAGLYAAYGIGGKIKHIEGYGSTSDNSFGDRGFKRFDFGAQLGVGATLGNLYASIGFDLGLADIGTSNYLGSTTKTTNWTLSIGYNF